jgi:hypothetical protein
MTGTRGIAPLEQAPSDGKALVPLRGALPQGLHEAD